MSRDADLTIALWNTAPSYQFISPLAAVGALSDPEELGRLRFGNANDDLAASIARDNAADDAILQSYLDDAQLEQWYQSAKDVAKETALEISAKEAENEEELQQFDKSIIEPGFKRVRATDLTMVRDRQAMVREALDTINGYDEDAYGDVYGGAEDEEVYADEENGVDADGDIEMG